MKVLKIIFYAVIMVIIFYTFLWIFADWLEGDDTPMVMQEYVISEKETLWQIASEYKPKEMSYEQYLYELRQVNEDISTIYPGQKINILKEVQE